MGTTTTAEPLSGAVLDPALAGGLRESAALVHQPPATAHASESHALAPRIEGVEFSREQVELIKRTIAQGATDDELQLFLWTCRRLRLDPFARQIFLVKRRQKVGDQWLEVAQPQVSIDGFRLVAERTGKYGGPLPTQWCDEDLNWYDVWPFGHAPLAARVRVTRRDFKQPVEVVARWDAYVQTTRDGAPNSMWAKRGPEQLAKCGEAQALRIAFPNELSGVYTIEEMGQAENETEPEARRGSARPSERASERRAGAARADQTPAQAAAEARVPLYPFAPYKDIPLDRKQRDAASGSEDYVISVKALKRAAAWAATKQEERAAKHKPDDPRIAEVLADMAAELERREQEDAAAAAAALAEPSAEAVPREPGEEAPEDEARRLDEERAAPEGPLA